MIGLGIVFWITAFITILLFAIADGTCNRIIGILAIVCSIVTIILGVILLILIKKGEQGEPDPTETSYQTTIIDGTEYELVPKYQTTVINGTEYKLVPSDQ